MTISRTDSPQSPPQDSPRPAPSAPARPPAPNGPELMVPRGAVKVLVGLLRQTGGDPAVAAIVARRYSGGTDDPRYALLAGILEECDTDPSVAAIGRPA